MKGSKRFGLMVMGAAMAMTLAFGVKMQASAAYKTGEEFYNTQSTGNGEMAQVVKYKVIKEAKGQGRDKAGEVEVVGCRDNAKKIVIQASIPREDGTYYRTKKIADGCFKDNKKLTFVQINDCDITAIPASCFSGCVNLKKVQIQDPDLKTIGKKAFNNCKKLKTFDVVSKKLTKGSVKAKAFKNVENVKVIAPSESKAKKYASIFKARGAKNTTYEED